MPQQESGVCRGFWPLWPLWLMLALWYAVVALDYSLLYVLHGDASDQGVVVVLAFVVRWPRCGC